MAVAEGGIEVGEGRGVSFSTVAVAAVVFEGLARVCVGGFAVGGLVSVAGGGEVVEGGIAVEVAVHGGEGDSWGVVPGWLAFAGAGDSFSGSGEGLLCTSPPANFAGVFVKVAFGRIGVRVEDPRVTRLDVFSHDAQAPAAPVNRMRIERKRRMFFFIG